ncbi:Uncharacterised protein [Mycobacterium tuberculosis]|nr:Uncharacterised protein [Mycobacterium tuberculosis]
MKPRATASICSRVLPVARAGMAAVALVIYLL